jgi:1-acyl-sn-glycerol-3-phosphate acyltransferase
MEAQGGDLDMIYPCKSERFAFLFDHYNRRLLRRSFHQVHAKCSLRLDLKKPTVYVSNHCSWWDGLIAFHLNRTLLLQDAHVMMSEVGLRRFPFFRKLGAFSVQAQSSGEIRRALQFSIELLQEPGRSLWLFPQGEIRHQDIRPLSCRPGIGYLLDRLPEVQIVPVSMYYCFLEDQRPEVYTHIGESLPAWIYQRLSRKDKVQFIEEHLTNQLNDIRAEVIHNKATGYTAISNGAPAVSERFTRFFRRA